LYAPTAQIEPLTTKATVDGLLSNVFSSRTNTSFRSSPIVQLWQQNGSTRSRLLRCVPRLLF
jgi:hypothetical protein